MTRIIQSISVPDGSFAHQRLKSWKIEGVNISAYIQMLIERDDLRQPDTVWPADWRRPSPVVAKTMAGLRCILFDVDGVFTDGTILRDGGGVEQRSFSVIDGHGTALLRKAGLIIGVVSREASEITQARMEKLQMEELHIGVKDKAEVLRDIKSRHELSADQVAFMGDDLPDLAAFGEAGVRLAPANAQPKVRAAADWISISRGGTGAVREACEVILSCMGG